MVIPYDAAKNAPPTANAPPATPPILPINPLPAPPAVLPALPRVDVDNTILRFPRKLVNTPPIPVTNFTVNAINAPVKPITTILPHAGKSCNFLN